MDRFEWCNGELLAGEASVGGQDNVTLYDGEKKTGFEKGNLQLTSHRILWKLPQIKPSWLSLQLSLIVYTEFDSGKRLIMHLGPVPPGLMPVAKSRSSFVKLSFKQGAVEFERRLKEQLEQRRWETRTSSTLGTRPGATSGKTVRTGIVGIERQIQERAKVTDASISRAFEDLSKLIDKAKDMVTLSKSISQKIRDKQGGISEDETVKFKSYLLSLGISDPVTRGTHGSGSVYLAGLAKELSSVLEKPLQDCGGMMTLTDVYCRLNRARGMELLSPDDLVDACHQLQRLKLPVRMRVFDSGVMVLHLAEQSDDKLIEDTTKVVETQNALSAEELAQSVGVSVLLAKQRLLLAEAAGRLCRDETVAGIKFYPNLFLTKA